MILKEKLVALHDFEQVGGTVGPARIGCSPVDCGNCPLDVDGKCDWADDPALLGIYHSHIKPKNVEEKIDKFIKENPEYLL